MRFLPKNLVAEGTITILRNKNIEEWKATIDLLLHSELNGRGLIIEMIEEEIQFFLAVRPDNIGVIHISSPKLWQEPGRV